MILNIDTLRKRLKYVPILVLKKYLKTFTQILYKPGKWLTLCKICIQWYICTHCKRKTIQNEDNLSV